MADYISREAALADFEQCNRKNSTWTPQRVKTLLMRIPAADVEPVRHGKWNIRLADEITLCLECSECGRKVDNIDLHNKLGDPLERYGGCEICSGGRLESDFCSYGRTREVGK